MSLIPKHRAVLQAWACLALVLYGCETWRVLKAMDRLMAAEVWLLRREDAISSKDIMD